MKRIAIDTNWYTDLQNGVPDAVESIRSVDQIFIPFVVLGELRAGFGSSNRATENERKLQGFLAAPRVRPLHTDERTTQVFAELSIFLRRNGTPLPQNDVWIAALCVQHGVPLYTRDAHFDRLPQVMRV